MKQYNGKKVGLVLSLGLTSLMLGSALTPQAHAAQPATLSSLDEGTETQLTLGQIADLLPWATDSQKKLKDLLEVIKSMSLLEKRDALYRGIYEVFPQGGQSRRTEILMRFVLNRGIKIAREIYQNSAPGESGVTDAQVRILKSSVEMAIGYYESDVAYLKSLQNGGTPMQIAFARFGYDYARALMVQDRAITNAKAQYNAAMMALEWLKVDLNRDEKLRTSLASVIQQLDTFTRSVPEQAGNDDGQTVSLMPRIRKAYQTAMKNLEGAITPAQPPLDASHSTSEPFEMKFKEIQPGSFMMGSPEGELGRDDGEDLHRVQLTNRFEMQQTTVTQRQYFEVMGSMPSRFKEANYCPKSFITIHGTGLCPNNPVEQVSWDDAQSFIQKLNATLKDGYVYRLPTEAEWEFAARAGTSTAYSFGNDSSQLALYGWFEGNSGGQTHEVAQLRPNGFGLYDMNGNVWHWVQDWHGDYNSTAQMNPTGASSGSSRVVRGGSWFFVAQFLRSAFRNYVGPDYRSPGVGFRLVRTR
ncbi:formylglycine-generating enzyme family protein [Bdellovibrionota bacterium FG-1]